MMVITDLPCSPEPMPPPNQYPTSNIPGRRDAQHPTPAPPSLNLPRQHWNRPLITATVQHLFFTILVLVGTIGCSQPGELTVEGLKAVQTVAKVDTVQAIRQQTNYGSTVHLKGKVGKQAPLLAGAAYQLQDATGSIWILAKEPVPKQGDEVVIKGKLRYQKIQLNGKDQGSVYVEQQEQLQPLPSPKSEPE